MYLRPLPLLLAGLTALPLLAPPAMADPPLATAAPLPAPPRFDENRALRFTGGISLAGFGVLFTVLGGVLGVRAIVDKSQIGAHCDAAARCDLVGYTLGSEAQDFAELSTVGLVIGLPAVVAGVVLAVSGAPKKGRERAWLMPATGTGGRTIGVRW